MGIGHELAGQTTSYEPRLGRHVLSSELRLLTRNADTYADFLIPHLDSSSRLLDLGCGEGTISLGLSRHVDSVIGIDPLDDFTAARKFAESESIENVEFRIGDAYSLEFPDEHFDACICHSVIEALTEPNVALAEVYRVLKPGAVVGAASVEYGGIIMEGGGLEELEKFYGLRLNLWELQGIANPYRGRELRRLFNQAGFQNTKTTSKYISHGTDMQVREFGLARADECANGWFSKSVEKFGLASKEELNNMQMAWESWAESDSSYFAFPFCRSVGFKPD